MMKVAFVTSTLGEHGGGVATVIEALSKEVADLGVQVKVFGVATQETEKYTVETWRGAQMEVFRPFGPSRLAFSPAMTRALFSWKPDVVHMHGLWQFHGVSVRLWKQLRRKPLIVSAHGMLDPWALSQSRIKKRIALSLFDRFNLKYADRLHSLCREESKAFCEFGFNTDIVEIPNGVAMTDLDEEQTRRRAASIGKERRRNLVYLGRIQEKKGLRNLIEALTIIERQEQLGQWHITIAGWSQEGHVEELKALCRQNRISARVEFAGPAFGPAKASLLGETASAFILPSQSEGLPMTVLEAWSYGLPVIMTDACNLQEGFEAGAAHRISIEPKQMAKDLLAFFELEDTHRAEMGTRGLRLSRTKFNWEIVARRFISEYASMVEEK